MIMMRWSTGLQVLTENLKFVGSCPIVAHGLSSLLSSEI